MSNPKVVIAMYRPKNGKVKELEALIERHFPTLKQYGLTTDKEPFVGQSADESYLEIFEWASEESAKEAHAHPAVAKIWEAMAMVCDFGKLEQLPESHKVFPHFQKAF